MKVQFDNVLEKKVDSLLSRLCLAEKVALLSGLDTWRTVPIPRLKIPSILMTDGPHGVRTVKAFMNRKTGPATYFPTGFSMGASWDPVLLKETASALAEETRFYECDILLGPCINIVRVPLNGRAFETYSEDPYLTGRMAVEYVKGLQDKGIGASVKHFACNNQEIERFRGSSEVDERALREIYLPGFEAAVKETQPATVMSSYNRVNGVYASQNRFLLTKILREEWGFQGMVVSDWAANHTTIESVQSGLDMEMPGPALYFGSLLENAVRNWQVEEEVIDLAARRVLRVVLALARARKGKGSANTKAHQAVARKLAESSMVLLKNDDQTLPLKAESLKTLAVLGPNADHCAIGGGSSYVPSPYRISPLEGLRKHLKNVKILHQRGCENFTLPPVVPTENLKPSHGKGRGILLQYFNNLNFKGKPVKERVVPKIDYWSFTPPLKELSDAFSLRYTGYFRVPENGDFQMSIYGAGGLKLFVDGKLVAGIETPTISTESPWKNTETRLALRKNRWYRLRIDYVHPAFLTFNTVRLGAGRASATGFKEEIAQAVDLAARSDAAIVVAGYTDGHETEGKDRPDLRLLGSQVQLIEAVAAVNPRTIVVVNAGSPVEMPWADKVQVILFTGYAGMEMGEAIARILLGEVNPSGKLPVTFPKRLEDTPAYGDYPGNRQVHYGEGIFVGYRWYDKREIDPLFCFGHGLSYTEFGYSGLSLLKAVKKGKTVSVSLTVTNKGKAAGAEVVQLYVGNPTASVPRPARELKGFMKVRLKPGESTRLTFKLDQRALSFFHPDKKKWTAEPGQFTVEIGSSSRDIRLKSSFKLMG